MTSNLELDINKLIYEVKALKAKMLDNNKHLQQLQSHHVALNTDHKYFKEQFHDRLAKIEKVLSKLNLLPPE